MTLTPLQSISPPAPRISSVNPSILLVVRIVVVFMSSSMSSTWLYRRLNLHTILAVHTHMPFSESGRTAAWELSDDDVIYPDRHFRGGVFEDLHAFTRFTMPPSLSCPRSCERRRIRPSISSSKL
ncbi:hypothetical protein PYCCODRAFT_1218453 [Trametes coccinea BRFM310]|uniref:Uncharacterized protein n=1 Tax=Trametes coccinea (strain BRFM310) TaxID=1353009 RepID=A0A1Y2I6S5_TRAC3|nr:hypothetical protein PYCCODRAFT_1218453 [Trametes coccinea BRFM310]